jgi:glycosyltransferase involved in cell wall biosynthesis
LRGTLAEQGFHAAVWLTAPPGCAFAMGMRLAPVQIYFTMKYHSLSIPEFDDYLSGGPAGQKFNTIDGRRYRIGQTRYAELVEPSLASRAAGIRAELGPQWTILGCLGREDKINSAAFLSAVCAILARHPQTVFLWTGRAQLPAIQDAFEKAGVAGRCLYIGWVDTRLYAQVLDIFLDSFPFPCGLTALQTMAAGKPVVFFDSPEARETGVPVFVQPVLEGKAGDETQRARYRELLQPDANPPLFPFARDAGRYGDLVDLLVTDPGYRDRVGRALKSFVAEYIIDSAACGRTYEAHIFEAIDAAAAGDKPPAAA